MWSRGQRRPVREGQRDGQRDLLFDGEGTDEPSEKLDRRPELPDRRQLDVRQVLGGLEDGFRPPPQELFSRRQALGSVGLLPRGSDGDRDRNVAGADVAGKGIAAHVEPSRYGAVRVPGDEDFLDLVAGVVGADGAVRGISGPPDVADRAANGLIGALRWRGSSRGPDCVDEPPGAREADPGEPKTHAQRQIPLPPSVVELLARHMESVASDPDAVLFTSSRGLPLRYSRFRPTVWVPLLDDAALPRCGLHVLRHSAAPRMIASGWHPKAVQHVLGHESPSFTLRVYGHLFDTDLDDLAAALDRSSRGLSAGSGR